MLHIYFPDFKISHIPRSHNGILNFLDKIESFFSYRTLLHWLFYSGLITQTTSNLSNRVVVCCQNKIVWIHNKNSNDAFRILLYITNKLYFFPHQFLLSFLFLAPHVSCRKISNQYFETLPGNWTGCLTESITGKPWVNKLIK